MGFPVNIVGNLTSDLELRYTQSGIAVASGTIAVNERKFNRDTNEWLDGEPTFVRVSVWRELGEHAAASLTKGTRVMAAGKIALQEYETKDGTKGSSLEMQVDEIGPSMRYATAAVTKAAPRAQAAPGQAQAPAGYGQQTPGYGQAPAQPGWPQAQPQAQPQWPGQQAMPPQWGQQAYNSEEPF